MIIKKIFGYMLLVAVFIIPTASFGAEFRTGEQPNVSKNEKIENDLYIGGSSVTSSGNIIGDLVTGGGNIIVSGDVEGDIMAIGGNINIIANIGDDVRVGGGTIVIEGEIGGDIIAGGGQINIGGQGIAGDVIIGAGSVTINAPIMGKLQIISENVYINSLIMGDIKIDAETIILGSSAVISSNLNYKANKELILEEGAIVQGEINFEQKGEKKHISKTKFRSILSGFLLLKFFALLVSALFFGLIFRRYSEKIVDFAKQNPLLQLGRGLIILITLPVISVLLLVSLIGFPIGFLGLFGFFAILLFSWIMAPIFLGSVLYNHFSKGDGKISWQIITLGVIIYSLLSILPFIGWLIQAILIFITIGSMVKFKWQIMREWR
jgi:hypothetical protein